MQGPRLKSFKPLGGVGLDCPDPTRLILMTVLMNFAFILEIINNFTSIGLCFALYRYSVVPPDL